MAILFHPVAEKSLADSDLLSMAYLIFELQRKYPTAILGGSYALMLAKLLPYRNAHDFDLVSKDATLFEDLHLKDDSYYRFDTTEVPQSSRYSSYSGNYWDGEIYRRCNLLLHHSGNPDIETEIIYYNNTPILIQKIDTIIEWKRKYNRKKDLQDLDAIAQVLVERAVFNTEER